MKACFERNSLQDVRCMKAYFYSYKFEQGFNLKKVNNIKIWKSSCSSVILITIFRFIFIRRRKPFLSFIKNLQSKKFPAGFPMFVYVHVFDHPTFDKRIC